MNDKIKLLIWSKDRACQLHLLLEGIHKHLPNVFDITVLFATSGMTYDMGYYKLKSQFEQCEWIREYDFHDDTIRIMQESTHENICLSTDDTIVFKTPFISPISNLSYGEVFSFRLGLNTLLQNPFDGMIQPPLVNPVIKFDGDLIHWNAMGYGPTMNYGYPFGMDMHSYNRDQFLGLTNHFHFNSSTELEGNLFHYRDSCPYMYAFGHSVAVNVPVNKLSNTQYAGEKVQRTMLELNELYLSGKKIDLSAIEQQEVIGCHQLIDLELIDG